MPSSNSANILYPTLPIANDLVRSTSIDSSSSSSPKRSTALISRQHQSIDQTNIVPPPVPPRPNKELLRERLLNVDMQKNSNDQILIDEKKENR